MKPTLRSQVAPSTDDSGCTATTSVRDTMKLLELPWLTGSGVRRVLCLTVTLLLNALTVIKGLCLGPMFLQFPIAMNTETTLLIVFVIYQLYCGFVNFHYVKHSWSGTMSSFLKDVDCLVASSTALPALDSAMSQQLRKYLRLFNRLLAVFLLLAIVNAAVCSALIITNPNLPPYKFSVRLALPGQKDPLPSVDQAPWTQVTWQVVSALLWTYSSFTWILGFFGFIAQVLILTHLQSAFNRGLASQTQECPSLSEDCASAYRLVYLKVVEIVGSADDMMRLYVCATFLFCLSAVMLIVNALLDSASLSTLAVSMMAFWLTSGIALLCISVWICGRVSNLVRFSVVTAERCFITQRGQSQ